MPLILYMKIVGFLMMRLILNVPYLLIFKGALLLPAGKFYYIGFPVEILLGVV